MRWQKSAPNIILSSWPFLCQKLSKLVKIWQSYHENNYDCFLLRHGVVRLVFALWIFFSAYCYNRRLTLLCFSVLAAFKGYKDALVFSVLGYNVCFTVNMCHRKKSSFCICNNLVRYCPVLLILARKQNTSTAYQTLKLCCICEIFSETQCQGRISGGPGPQASHQQGASHQTPQFLKLRNSITNPGLHNFCYHLCIVK